MKKSKRTKSRNSSPNSSIRKTKEPASLRGLITNNQQSIRTESQVSGYTQKTSRSNTFASSQEFDIADEQIDKDDMHQVFINQEEEKLIQKILQVARKGKINQKNAFQIPLKVLDNENISIGKAKFWKFASQLLGASMNIYQKRIENTWINTNLIHDKLARMIVDKNNKKQNDDDQNAQGRNKIQSEFIMLPIQQFRDPKILQNIRLGQQTLETPAKINIPRFKIQYHNDPLFNRKLKTFDNTSIKGLLLNVFDLDSSCQIQLFSYQNKLLPKPESKIKTNQYTLPAVDKLIARNIMQSKQLIKNQMVFSNVLQFKKDNIVKNQEEQEGQYDSIGFLKAETLDKQNTFLQQLQDFFKQTSQNLQSQMPLNQDFFNNDTNELVIKAEDQKTNPSQLDPNNHQYITQLSQKSQNSPFTFSSDGPFSYHSDLDRSFHSVMTPWQIEFKQGKIKVKSTRNKSKKQVKKRQRIPPQQISFNANHMQIKKLVLNVKKMSAYPEKRKKEHSNLIPPYLTVYQKVNYKKVVQFHKAEDKLPKVQQNLPDFLAPDPSMIHQNLNQVNQGYADNRQSIPIHQQFKEIEDVILYSNSKNHKAGSQKFNIRQTKKTIYERAKDQRQLKISQIELPGLTPASILITFLHIANQKNMVVRNTSQEDDVILSWE